MIPFGFLRPSAPQVLVGNVESIGKYIQKLLPGLGSVVSQADMANAVAQIKATLTTLGIEGFEVSLLSNGQYRYSITILEVATGKYLTVSYNS